jgi:tetratricopeptide (TPR) repeat protein
VTEVQTRRLAALALVLVVIAAHAMALGAGFVWDDDDYVTENPQLLDAPGLARIWTQLGAVPQYYPLVHTTFWIEHHLWGEQPVGYHAVNVLLHAACALLVWTILRRLEVPGAWLAAALFGVHPVHAESVAWIAERKNVLSGVFYLGALLAWLEHDENEVPRAYRWSLLLFVAALLSKTVTATLPAALLLITWWKRGTITKRDVLATLPYFALGAAAGALTSWMERFHVGATGGDWALGLAERVQVAGRAVWFYLGKLVWPDPLMFIYPRWKVDAWGPEAWLAPIAAAAVVVALWLLRARIGRGPLAAALYFGMTLGPALGFVNVYPMRFAYVADHFQYLASLGPLALAAACAARLDRKVLSAAVPIVLLTLSAVTWRQERAYKDEETLWRRTIAIDPDVFLAQNNLGGILLGRGADAEAEAHFLRAIAIEPTYPEAYDNLGILLHRRGRLDEAIERYREALRLDPRYSFAHNNLGISLGESGRLDEAIASFREAVRLKPDFARAHFNLGVALYRRGDRAGAAAALREAGRLDPGDPDIRGALRAVVGAD